MNKIFIGNLSFNLDERDLEKAFNQFGEISEIKIPLDRDSGRKRGFAFITFNEDKSAEDALSMNAQDLDKRPLTVKMAQGKKTYPNNSNGYKKQPK
jgi:heterogeneous nuclear ribonucleoprotein A1/A3